MVQIPSPQKKVRLQGIQGTYNEQTDKDRKWEAVTTDKGMATRN